MNAPLRGILIALVVGLGLGVASMLWLHQRRAAARAELTALGQSLPVLFSLGEFDFETQGDARVGNTSLQGRPYVANVFFGSCTSICPGVMRAIKKLDAAVTNPNVRIVSFTLDPARDTKDVLQQYARSTGASGRWCFARAVDQQAILKFTRERLRMAVETTDDPDNISHSGQLLLVDADGNARGIYSSNDPEDLARLAKDADTLAGKR